MANYRVTQAFTESLLTDAYDIRVTQAFSESILTDAYYLLVTQTFAEVIRSVKVQVRRQPSISVQYSGIDPAQTSLYPDLADWKDDWN